MSGDWAWDKAISIGVYFGIIMSNNLQDLIAADPETHCSIFVPIILGSDKTTVSIATRNDEYYLLYASIGNVCNNVWHAYREALTVIGFLAIPKSKYLVNTPHLSFLLNFVLFLYITDQSFQQWQKNMCLIWSSTSFIANYSNYSLSRFLRDFSLVWPNLKWCTLAMDIFSMSSMVLDLTLLIMRSRHYWPVSFEAGVYRKCYDASQLII